MFNQKKKKIINTETQKNPTEDHKGKGRKVAEIYKQDSGMKGVENGEKRAREGGGCLRPGTGTEATNHGTRPYILFNGVAVLLPGRLIKQENVAVH